MVDGVYPVLQAMALMVMATEIETAPGDDKHVGALPSVVRWTTAPVVVELNVAVCVTLYLPTVRSVVGVATTMV